MFGDDQLKSYAKNDQLLNLTPILNELQLKDAFFDLSAFTTDGRVYGLPFKGKTSGFYYNTKKIKNG